MRWSSAACALTALAALTAPVRRHSEGGDVVLTRNVRRMQPEASGAVSQPRAPLEWGQLNFMHTTDTHGWLEGHLKEQNYGADWGDFASFVNDMRAKARQYSVDLLVVDTGDLHDGAGLSDATGVDGAESDRLFDRIDYDVLTPGNHELYLNEVTYAQFYNMSRRYGDRYVTSNVQVYNPDTSQWEYMGVTHRSFTTEQGLRITAFGVIFNFTLNGNASRVIPAAEMVTQSWFQDALRSEPVDLYLLVGHNPARPTVGSSTWSTVYDAIRAVHPDTPIQIFGGHNHIRDFAIYDEKTTALGAGRYCETLGWLSMSGIPSNTYEGAANPVGIPNPKRRAISMSSNSTRRSSARNSSFQVSSPLYSRRYLDWNRLTFEYHAAGSQSRVFNDRARSIQGLETSQDIHELRHKLNITKLYGCAPKTWCISCEPFMSPNSIYTLLSDAVSTVAVNESRADNARIIIQNTGSVRFDVPKGPFTHDDTFTVSSWTNSFWYIPAIPFDTANQVLATLNAPGAKAKRSDLSTADFAVDSISNPALPPPSAEECTVPAISHSPAGAQKRSLLPQITRRQNPEPHPGYVTRDDFGSDGDDTVHSPIPKYEVPKYFAADGTFPCDGSLPATVDLVFTDFVTKDVLAALGQLGGAHNASDVQAYMPKGFTTNTYLALYAQQAEDWQVEMPECPLGLWVGYADGEE